MKKVAILALTSALLVLAFGVAPVLAVGPLKAVGKNPNVEDTGIPTLAMMDVPSDNTFMWINNPAVSTYGHGFSMTQKQQQDKAESITP